MKFSYFKKHFFGISVLALIILRAILNAFVPLMDKTEARYAEIARIMAETNDYITPQIDYGIPFWAKPPLSTWLSALSFEVFGINEFAARFPYLVLSVLIVFLIGKYAKKEGFSFYLSGFIALTIPEFLIHAGVVSTDTALMFCVTLVMISFWEIMQDSKKTTWKILLFTGFGFGLLAKGPIIFILTLPPIFFWSLLTKSFFNIFKKINLLIALIAVAIIAVPWYFLAEEKTPGFIDYFIVGEHFKRFFDSSWSGDKYGFPKQQPLGIIWVFLLVFALPWIQTIIGKLIKNRKSILQNSWLIFLLMWLLWTPTFFTISKSLIHPYIMPVMVPITLLAVHFWKEIKQKKLLIGISLIIPVLALAALIYGTSTHKIAEYSNSDKYFIQQTCKKEIPLYHFNTKSYSSQFYSAGKINSLPKEKLDSIIALNTAFYLIIPKREISQISKDNLLKMKELDKNQKKKIFIINN